MTPVLRYAPGERVPFTGTYALVGHYGEATGFSVACDKGETLPIVSVPAEYEWMWFIHVGEAIALSKAA